MQDYTESEKVDREKSIAFIGIKNEPNEVKEFYHTNILISLVKECTKEKMNASNMIRSIHYQLYTILFIGFSLTFVFCYSYQIPLLEQVMNTVKFPPSLTVAIATEIVVLSISILFLPLLLKKYLVYSSENFGGKLVTFRWLLLPICFSSLSIIANSFYANLSTLTIFLLTFLFTKKLESTYSRLKIIDNNLAKAIRTTSQYREHIASSFITKAKLEIALKTAEDVLENPHFYF
jgi:hypothetical protein